MEITSAGASKLLRNKRPVEGSAGQRDARAVLKAAGASAGPGAGGGAGGLGGRGQGGPVKAGAGAGGLAGAVVSAHSVGGLPLQAHPRQSGLSTGAPHPPTPPPPFTPTSRPPHLPPRPLPAPHCLTRPS